MVECLPPTREALASIPSTTLTGYGSAHLSFKYLENGGRKDDLEYMVPLWYIIQSQPRLQKTLPQETQRAQVVFASMCAYV